MRDGDWLTGMGCATAVYPTQVAPATARVRLRSDGDVLVQSASQEIGTGIRTVAGQMWAEQLGVSFDQVKVEMGDTNLPPAPVSGGSNSTASVCSAVLTAMPADPGPAVPCRRGVRQRAAGRQEPRRPCDPEW